MARIYMINSQTRVVYTSYENNPASSGRPNAIQLVGVDGPTIANPPSYDPSTERLERQFDDDDIALTRTFKKVVIPLTQAEIDQRTENQDDDTERQAIKPFYQDLKNGTGNNAERLRRVERMLAWLIRRDLK